MVQEARVGTQDVSSLVPSVASEEETIPRLF